MKQDQSILVVDDEQIMRDLYCRLLRKEYKVVTAKNGYEAIEAVKRDDFDVIFMDIKMPGKDGVETLKEIKKIKPEAAVFMMTAFEVPELIEEALNEGANGCLYKPFDVEDVRNAARNRGFTLNKLPVQNEDTKLLLDIEDIFYIRSRGDYVSVYIDDQQFLTRITLAELEKRLSQGHFARIHRSYIVNMDKVREVVPISRKGILLVLADKKRSTIPVSRDRAKEIKQLLGVRVT